MFGFLTTPYLLLGAGAALLPIIIHLIRRNKPQIVHFAALRFLDVTPLHLLRYQKLKHILLLLLRILALLLLGLAFARPFLAGDHVPVLLGGEPRAIAVIADVSASMAANHHFSAARESAREVIRQAASGDRVWLIGAATTLELLAENAEPDKAEAALAQLAPRQTAGNLREALLFADQLLSRATLQRRAIYLISDLQASNMPAGTLVLNSNAECFPIAVQPPWQNVALLDGQILESSAPNLSSSATARSFTTTRRGNRFAPASRQESGATYACRVRNFSESDQQIEVRLFAGAASAAAAISPIATQTLSLAARAEQVAQFPAPSALRERAASRDLTIYFEVKAPVDDLPADNRFFVVAQPEKKRRLLVLSGHAEAAYFVNEALRLPGSLYQAFEANANNLNQFRLEDFDVVLVVGVAGVNRSAAEALRQYAEQGGGLILTLGAALQSDMYNQFLAEVLPGKIAASVRPGDRAAGNAPSGAALTEIDFGHPIFKIFVDPSNGDPTAVQVAQYYRVEPGPQAVRLAGFEDGGAALLERGVGKGKVLLWTSGLDLAVGNLPVRGIFVPLLYQWLSYVSRPDMPRATTHVGQPLFLGETVQPNQPLTLTLPDGAPRTFENLQPAVLKETPLPGFYRVQQNRQTSWYAVNLDAQESDPAAMATENMAARLIRPDEQTLSGVAGIFGAPEVTSRDAEKQQKLWRLGLWALLILLLGEVWLANRTLR
jgi:hypothetical protein